MIGRWSHVSGLVCSHSPHTFRTMILSHLRVVLHVACLQGGANQISAATDASIRFLRGQSEVSLAGTNTSVGSGRHRPPRRNASNLSTISEDSNRRGLSRRGSMLQGGKGERCFCVLTWSLQSQDDCPCRQSISMCCPLRVQATSL